MVTRADLPDPKHYPFKPAGRAVKLGFAGAPGDVAIGGRRRSPIAVVVQDENGKSVREGTYAVRLALKNPGPATLTGTLTAETVNGIATFPDVEMDRAGRYQLTATATGLQAATSAAFEAGPGNGLLRQWWTGTNDPTNAVDDTEILGRALETPVVLATNFSARIRGELIAPQSGEYRFWIAASCPSELWLGAAAAPTDKRQIAAVTRKTPYSKWPHTSEAGSSAVTLQAGKHYYFEIRQHQDSGSTQLAVRWQLPDGREERPIPAWHFVLPQK